MVKVRFNCADVPTIRLKEKNKVKEFIQQLFNLEGKELEHLQYVFCSDDYLLQMNKSFLQHDYFTDIITFDLSIKGKGTNGEIYISVDRVRDNAINHFSTFSEELLRVIFHGALHLCGYKDKKKSEITIMREKEDYYLRVFGEK